jgi:hypothetical protein
MKHQRVADTLVVMESAIYVYQNSVKEHKKMVKFRVKANPSGQYYLPKEVRQELGNKLELICNTKAAVIFPQGIHPETVLRSLEVIQKDLHHRSYLRNKDAHAPHFLVKKGDPIQK